MIPYGRHSIDDEDIAAVEKVLRSDFLTQGPAVPEFERALSEYCGAAYCTAVNSATSALHLACLALGLGPGDILWSSPISFVASTNCAKYCGAEVNFIDICLSTYNMDMSVLRSRLQQAEIDASLPKIIVAVHMAGRPCEMKELKILSEKYNFSIIEDASHALGATYLNAPVGSCEFSDACIFSFHPVKNATSAEGGAVLTNTESLHSHIQSLRTHGIIRPETNAGEERAWFYEQVELGFNYRMSDVHAALGRSQLRKVSGFIESRNEIANKYHSSLSLLAPEALYLPSLGGDHKSAFHLFVVRLKQSQHISSHKAIFTKLRESGIGVQLHYIPIYRHPYYCLGGRSYFACPNAETYYSSVFSLPIYPNLSEAAFSKVCTTLVAVLDTFKP